LGVSLAALVGNAGSAAASTSTFTYTGSEQTFVVPAGVSSVHVVATGGHGESVSGGGAGGAAATVTGDLAVTPAETLYVEVGGVGGGGLYGGGGAGGQMVGAGGGGGGSSKVPGGGSPVLASASAAPQVQITFTPASGTIQTFSYTGGEQTFTVPANVTTLHVV